MPPLKSNIMKKEVDTIYFIKAVCEKRNRERVKKLILGAVLLNVGAYLAMWGFIHLVVAVYNA